MLNNKEASLLLYFENFVHNQQRRLMVCFGLVYLFNGMSTPEELFNAEITFICKCLIIEEEKEKEKEEQRLGWLVVFYCISDSRGYAKSSLHRN